MASSRRLVAIALGLIAGVAPVAGAPGKTLDLRPEPPLRPKGALEGKAAGYYAFCLSQQALLERDFEAAHAYLEEAVRADPGSPDLAMELARVLLGLQRANDALNEARRAAQLDPASLEPRRFIVDLFQFELGRNDSPSPRLLSEAIEAHLDLLRLDPGDVDARIGLARIQYAQGSYSQAAGILEPLAAAHPENREAILLRARALARSGSPAEGRDLLERGVEARPSDADLRAELAGAREEAGDLAGAEDLLLDLVSGHPERRDYRFALVRVQERRGDHASAARNAAAIAEALGSPEAGTREESDLRAALLLQLEATASEDLHGAEKLSLEMSRRFPTEDRFALKRAEILFLLRRDDEANQILQVLGGRSGAEAVEERWLSLVLLRAGAREERNKEHARAEELLRRAIDLDAHNHAAMNYLAYMLAERNEKLDEALRLIERALELDSGNGAYLDSLGWTLYRIGRLDEAEKQLVRAAGSIPDEAVVRDHLGDVYWAQGRQADAIEAWESALELGIDEAARVEKKIREARKHTGG